MANIAITYTGQTGTTFSIASIEFSGAAPLTAQTAVTKNDAVLSGSDYAFSGNYIILSTALVASDVLKVERVTSLSQPYANYASYGDAPASGTLVNNQQNKFAIEELAYSLSDGEDGADGEGVATGGTAGQVLTKVDGTDFNTVWSDRSSVEELTDLTDVSTSGVVQGQSLVYHAGQWQPQTIASGGGGNGDINPDGGTPTETYLVSQIIDGGTP